MDKYKDDIKTIFQVFMFGIIYLSISSIDNPIVSILLSCLWIGYLIYNLYSKFQYRKGNANYIRIPTVNDNFYKISSLIFGLIICILSITAIVWSDNLWIYGVVGFVVGLLIFCNGIFDLPKGILKMEGSEMNIVGIAETFDFRQIKELNIYKDRIVVTNINNQNKKLGNLDINLVAAEHIEKYIFNNSKESNFRIIINVS